MLTVSLQLEGRRCVCIGGGTVAERRINYLIREGAHIVVISPNVTTQISNWAELGELLWKPEPYRKEFLEGAQFVFIMTDSPEINSQCVRDAKELGALVNRADKQSDCDFTLPAELRMGELHVTVSTGKCSPRLNRLLRMDMESRYTPIEVAVEGIKVFRQDVKNLLPTSKEREEFWQVNLTNHDLELILNGGWSQVEEKLKNAISNIRC